MPMYACHACKVRFFIHDHLGRLCPECRKAMAMVPMEATVNSYRVDERTGKPFFALESAPKYNGQLVLALIDGATVKWKGAAITGANQRGFLGDKEVPEKDRTAYSAQEGERQNAENLHEKEKKRSPAIKQLCLVQDYEPNSPEQIEKVRSALGSLPMLGGQFKLLLLAHHDPDSQRMAGLKPVALAGIIGTWTQAKNIKRITLVGCHTAGEAESAETAGKLVDVDSFGSIFHQTLGQAHGIFTEVAGYTAYIRIRPMGPREVRFDPKGAYKHQATGSKLLFYWDVHKRPARSFFKKD